MQCRMRTRQLGPGACPSLQPPPPCRHECPQWRPQDLSRVFPTLEEAGIDLLKSMLEYDPARRVTVSGLAGRVGCWWGQLGACAAQQDVCEGYQQRAAACAVVEQLACTPVASPPPFHR